MEIIFWAAHRKDYQRTRSRLISKRPREKSQRNLVGSESILFLQFTRRFTFHSTAIYWCAWTSDHTNATAWGQQQLGGTYPKIAWTNLTILARLFKIWLKSIKRVSVKIISAEYLSCLIDVGHEKGPIRFVTTIAFRLCCGHVNIILNIKWNAFSMNEFYFSDHLTDQPRLFREIAYI